jgi:hypothetical protein
MPDEHVHVTGIEKVGNGTHHAMHVRGVVDGKPVEGLVNVQDFQGKEREGDKALTEFLREGLSTIHEAEQERRR